MADWRLTFTNMCLCNFFPVEQKEGEIMCNSWKRNINEAGLSFHRALKTRGSNWEKRWVVDTLQTCTRGVQGAVILAQLRDAFNYASFDFL